MRMRRKSMMPMRDERGMSRFYRQLTTVAYTQFTLDGI
jgi:hypothetical protein